MSTGMAVFDKTLQTTNLWLDDLCETVGPDRRVAWRALGAVLRTLRDRLPPGLGAHLGAELPLLVRGAYYDQYRPDRLPIRLRDPDAFLERVREELGDIRPVDPRVAVGAVLALLDERLPEQQCRKLRHALPASLRELWPADGQDWSASDTGSYGYGYGPPPRRVRGYDDDWYE